MLKPLTIGKRTFPNNIIQGPLAGVSSAPFRSLTWRYSQPAFCYTEMISCKTILKASEKIKKRYLTKSTHEGAVSFQLAGSDVNDLAHAAKYVTDQGADLIDLNCGCPVKKVRQKNAGSKLLADPSLLYQLITALKQSTPLPISVKIRVQAHYNDQDNALIAKAISDAGADMLVVHGRHWLEKYDVAARYDEISFFVNALNIPVIGNGDIACPLSLEKMFATGCAGVMIARASVGQPWLISALTQGVHFQKPATNIIGEIYLEHINQLAELFGNEEKAILESRKLAKYYGRSLPHKPIFCEGVNQAKTLLAIQKLCSEHF